MIICNCILHLELPYVQSLKGRRSVTNSMKEKLKAFNLSVLDVSGEYAKEAELAVVYAAANEKLCAQVFQTIESLLQKRYPELQYDADLEML